jgi:hypothetical protein
MANPSIKATLPSVLSMGFGIVAGNIAMRQLRDSPWPLAILASAIAAAVVTLAVFYVVSLATNRRNQ